MTERERLIELIGDYFEQYGFNNALCLTKLKNNRSNEKVNGLADYLIENGIIALPRIPQEPHAEGFALEKIGSWQGNPKYTTQKQYYDSELDVRPIRYNEGEDILTLPVKIGDTVYITLPIEDWENWYIAQNQKPYQGKIIHIGINGIDNSIEVELERGRILSFPFSEIGKTVFLTREEAERNIDKNNV